MNPIPVMFSLSALFSYAYKPVLWPVGPMFQFGYNIPVWAVITQPTEAEERA